MSRVITKSDSRCPVCGGRMRLVNVTHVNYFQTPEASLYDQSVSRRKSGNTPNTYQEMMCFSCSRRAPLVGVGAKADKQAKKANKVKAVKPVKNEKKKNKNKKRGGSVFGTILFLAILAATVYFGYTYNEEVRAFLQPAFDFIANLFQQ